MLIRVLFTKPMQISCLINGGTRSKVSNWMHHLIPNLGETAHV